jgi:hypothetical protein
VIHIASVVALLAFDLRDKPAVDGGRSETGIVDVD